MQTIDVLFQNSGRYSSALCPACGCSIFFVGKVAHITCPVTGDSFYPLLCPVCAADWPKAVDRELVFLSDLEIQSWT